MNSPDIKRLYYSTREVCRMTNTRPYELKQWEKKYSELKPSVSKAGRRMYKPKDLEIIMKIKQLHEYGKSDPDIQYMLHHPEIPSNRNFGGKSLSIDELIRELQDLLTML
jgi:DNA-binding transcriptional MerR regulator